MKLKINDQEYELHFGLKFINTLDNIYTQEISGVKFGMGVEMMNTYLAMKHPQALLNVIKAGTSHLNSKPTEKDIENHLEKLAVEDKLNDLFDEVQETAKQAPFLKHKMKQMEKAQK